MSDQSLNGLPALRSPDQADEPSPPGPRLIFYSELEAEPLLALLADPATLALLRRHGGTLAVALREFGPRQVDLLRQLADLSLAVIVWLQADQGGGRLNLQNYPQALSGYRRFRAWAGGHDLAIAGVGLDMRPPIEALEQVYEQGISGALSLIWRGRENALYPAAKAAYLDLVAEIRGGGYETHVFQLPQVLDDRLAGSNLAQRAFNVVDLRADVEVLLAYSVLPFDRAPIDLGGGLIVAYGNAADAIAVGGIDTGPAQAPPWNLLRRDLLLAAQHTDTIYLFRLEQCAAQGLLPHLRELDWRSPTGPWRRRAALLVTSRALLVAWLFQLRFGPMVLGWMGWLVAALLLFQRWRQRRRA
jgi:hypothetical protein